jgi:hypothetical protein
MVARSLPLSRLNDSGGSAASDRSGRSAHSPSDVVVVSPQVADSAATSMASALVRTDDHPQSSTETARSRGSGR